MIHVGSGRPGGGPRIFAAVRDPTRRISHGRTLQGLLGTVAALLVIAGGLVATPAADAAVSGVPPGQTYHGNLTVRGQTASIQGTVDGNVSVQSHATVTVTGEVTGMLRAYGKSSVVIGSSGKVDKGLLESTGKLQIQPGAQVKKSLDTYNLSAPAVVGGDVAGPTRISASGFQLARQGQVTGDIWVWASRSQQVQVDGTVSGSVHVSGTNLHLGGASHVHGSTSVSYGKVVKH